MEQVVERTKNTMLGREPGENRIRQEVQVSLEQREQPPRSNESDGRSSENLRNAFDRAR